MDADTESNTQKSNRVSPLTDRTPEVRKDKPSQGVWPSRLCCICVLLTFDIGTSAFVTSAVKSWNQSGIVFFLPRMVVGIVAIVPIHFLESIVGQYTTRSYNIVMSSLGPIFGSLGIIVLYISTLEFTEYMDNTVWFVGYTYFSVAEGGTRWESCSADWNSALCYSIANQKSCNQHRNESTFYYYYNFTCISDQKFCNMHNYTNANGTHCLQGPNSRTASSRAPDNATNIQTLDNRHLSRLDFYNSLTGAKHEENMTPEAQRRRHIFYTVMVAILWLLVWLLTFNLWVLSWFSVIITFMSPIVIFLVLFRVVTLPGAIDGLNKFFLQGDLSVLTTFHCWVDAITIMCYSTGLGMGSISTIRSRARLQDRGFQVSIVVVSWNLIFSFCNVMLFYAVRGTIEKESNEMSQQLDELDADSRALVFVIYTTLLRSMPNPQFWGFLFFGTMALNVGACEVVYLVIIGFVLCDTFPFFNRIPFHWCTLAGMAPMMIVHFIRVTSVVLGYYDNTITIGHLTYVGGVFGTTLVLAWKLKNAELRGHLLKTIGIQLTKTTQQWLVYLWLGPSLLILLASVILTAKDVRVHIRSWVSAFIFTLECLPLALAAGWVLWLVFHRRIRGWALFRTTQSFQPDPRALLEIEELETYDSFTSLQTTKRSSHAPLAQSGSTTRRHAAPPPPRPPARVIY